MKSLLLVFLLSAFSAFATPVTIVTTSGPGSLSDQAARYIQPMLAKELGTEVIVVNAPGANGLVGIRAFHQLPKEGNHLLVGSFALAYVAKTNPQADIDPLVDFAALMGLTHAPQNIVVPANSPAKDAAGLAKISAAKGGLRGGVSHPSTNIIMAQLDKAIGATTEPIGYRQIAQLYTDLAAGVIDYTIGGSNQAAAGLIQSGHLRVLERIDQHGIEDFSWTGLFTRAGNENSRVAVAVRKVVTAESMGGLSQPFFKADSAALRRLMAKEFSLIPAQPK